MSSVSNNARKALTVARAKALSTLIGVSSSSIILTQGTHQAYADNNREINYPKVLPGKYLVPIQT
jgi:hypothetical protein